MSSTQQSNRLSVNGNMQLLSVVAPLLCASTALAANTPFKLGVFNKAPRIDTINRVPKALPLVEKHVVGRSFRNPELRKRAESFFLNDQSKREYRVAFIHPSIHPSIVHRC